jgi:hypothetical protein
MSRAQAFRWHKIFSASRTFVENEQLSGRPSTTRRGDNTARVRELVRSDRRLTIQIIADEVNMNWRTVRLIVTEELGMRKVCAKIVPKNLTELKWDARLSAVFTPKCITVMLQPPYSPDLVPRYFIYFKK